MLSRSRWHLLTAFVLIVSIPFFSMGGIIQAIVPQAVPVANKQGNGTLFQLSTGATVPSDCAMFDAAGNTVDAGAGCLFSTTNIYHPSNALLPHSVNVSVLTSDLATGDIDLYLCPANKRCLTGTISVFNSTGFSVTSHLQAKIGGAYFRTTANLVSGNGTLGTMQGNYILEAGESLAINTNIAATGYNLAGQIVQYDNTAALASKKLAGLGNGDNTVYTVPGGNSASNVSGNAIYSIPQGSVFFANDAGGARTIHWNLVPSAGTPATTNQMTPALSVSASILEASILPTSLTAGQFVSVNVNVGTATQLAWVNVLEY
jgi:hypothetical protein